MQESGYWQDLTSQQLRTIDAERTIAVLPVAAIEQHGPHLPLSTDALINEGIVSRALPRIPQAFRVLVLPALTIGHSLEHSAYPGTLTASAETLLALWVDVGRSVTRSGVRKLVFLNSHGGQKHLVDIAALRLRVELGMLAVRANYFSLGIPDGLFDKGEMSFGIHGGEIETSLLLFLRPESVRLDALGDFDGLPARMAGEYQILGAEKPVGLGWMSQDLNAKGVCGNASRADADRGEILLDHLVDRFIRLLSEVAALSLTTLRPTPAE